MTDQIENVEADAPEAVTEATETGLTIQDLTTAMQVIQVTGARGAIRADEMAVVGGLYNKLFTFLDAAGVIKREGDAPAESETSPETSPDAPEA